jgi:hypothetical protein
MSTVGSTVPTLNTNVAPFATPQYVTGGAAASQLYVVPIVSTIDASGASTVSTVTHETVIMKYDVSFNLTLSPVESANLVNSFRLYQNTTDASGNLECDLVPANQPLFHALMTKVIYDASDNGVGALDMVVYNRSYGQLLNVYGDGLANDLESNWNLTVAVDASGGASNMWEDLSGNADARKVIARQLPNNNYLAYCDASENIHTDALPLVNDDVLVFLFDVNTAVISTQTTELAGINNLPWYGAGATPYSSTTDVSGAIADLSGQQFGASINTSNATPSGLARTTVVDNYVAAFYVKVTGDAVVAPNTAPGPAAANLLILQSPNALSASTPNIIGGAHVAISTFGNAVGPVDTGVTVTGNSGLNNV